MDTKELSAAKKEMEDRILESINKELNSFRERTGLVVDEVRIRFAQFGAYNDRGDFGPTWIEKVSCNIRL